MCLIRPGNMAGQHGARGIQTQTGFPQDAGAGGGRDPSREKRRRALLCHPEAFDPAAAYRKGSLKFTLKGEKLHGNWALVRMGGKAANERHENWLLIKERDDEAVPQSGDAVVADKPLSVASGRSMDAIAADRDWVWHSNRGDNEKPPVQTIDVQDIPGARKRRIPDKLQ